jgi:hypothetical protein
MRLTRRGPEPLGQVDRRTGAIRDGGELLEVDGHALAVAVLADHPVVAEVLQQQPERGAGVLVPSKRPARASKKSP